MLDQLLGQLGFCPQIHLLELSTRVLQQSQQVGRQARQGWIPRQSSHPQAHPQRRLNRRGQLHGHQRIEAQGIQTGLALEISSLKAAELAEQLRQARLHEAQGFIRGGLRQRLGQRLQLQHQRIAGRSGLEISQDHLALVGEPTLQQGQGISRLQRLQPALVLGRHAATRPGAPVNAQARQARMGALLHQAIEKAIRGAIGDLAGRAHCCRQRRVTHEEVVRHRPTAAIQMERPLNLGGSDRRTTLGGLIA